MARRDRASTLVFMLALFGACMLRQKRLQEYRQYWKDVHQVLLPPDIKYWVTARTTDSVQQ
eukprot:SAG31_NODE_285_length_18479_cov_9.871980_14_plen_61_part_00